jgi:drug/metabolite transporter (DMT)-like permease
MTASLAWALLAALLFAVSAALQQRAARSTAQRLESGGRATAPLWAVLIRLLRNPWWLAGWAANAAGFGAHATALHLGSVAVVQAVLVVQLLFALPMATVRTGRRPGPRDWLGTAAVCAGLIVLLVLRGHVPQDTADRSGVPPVVAIAAAVIAALALTARLVRRHAQTGAALTAVAAGVCFSMTAIFTVLVTDDLARGGALAAALDWPLLGLALSTSMGGLLVQSAFSRGSLPTALTASTITDPVVSWVVGIVLFDAYPLPDAATLAGCVVAGALVVAGVVALANSPTLHDERAGYGAGEPTEAAMSDAP